MIKLGKLRGTNKNVLLSTDPINQSILLLGVSGSGKTNALRCLEKSLTESGACVLVLNFRSTHPFAPGESAKRILVRREGFPIPLFCPIKRPDGSWEESDDVVEGVLDVFDCVTRLSILQKKALREAFLVATNMAIGNADNSIQEIINYLDGKDDEASQRVLDKFRPFFRKVEISLPRDGFISSGQISVLDLEGYADSEQRIIAELALSAIWRYFRTWGQMAKTPLYVVLDEFQGLSLRSESVLTQILREGRKFNMALVLATQTLDMFERTQITIVRQPATHLFFRPAASEARKIGKIIGGKDIKVLAEELCSLRRGECVATGKFQIGNLITERPIRIQFPLYYVPTETGNEEVTLWKKG